MGNTATVEKTAGNAEGLPEEAAILRDAALAEAGPAPVDEGQEEGQERGPEPISLDAARMQARMMVDMCAGMAESAHPALVGAYPDPLREGVTEALTPVIVKYDGMLPPWLAAWKEEIGLAVVLGSVVFNSIRAIKSYQPPADDKGGADASPATS